MKKLWLKVVPAVLLSVVVTSCGAESTSGSQSSTAGYKETKTMVMDILKSEDGKKAIKAAQKGSEGGEAGGAAGQGNQSQIKLLSANDSLHLQMAVKDVLTADANSKFLQDMMKDPKFAGDFAKAIQAQMKQMHKDLLKDPEYQKSLTEAMKDPEFEKMLLDTMKTAQYRQQVMTIIQESMKSPLFRADLVELLKTAIVEQSQPGVKTKASSGSSKEEEKKKEGGSGGGESGGKSSGDGEEKDKKEEKK
jgi:spore germination protein D